jgi:hypothetical protein
MLPFPSDTRDTVSAMINTIGRNVTFYREYKTVCTVCGIDPISGNALDSSCPTCSGIGYLITLSGTLIKSHVTHGKLDTLRWVSAGQYHDGDSTAQIMYSPENLDMVKNSKYLVADNIKFTIYEIIPRGVPDLNRIILVLQEVD